MRLLSIFSTIKLKLRCPPPCLSQKFQFDWVFVFKLNFDNFTSLTDTIIPQNDMERTLNPVLLQEIKFHSNPLFTLFSTSVLAYCAFSLPPPLLNIKTHNKLVLTLFCTLDETIPFTSNNVGSSGQ